MRLHPNEELSSESIFPSSFEWQWRGYLEHSPSLPCRGQPIGKNHNPAYPYPQQIFLKT